MEYFETLCVGETRIESARNIHCDMRAAQRQRVEMNHVAALETPQLAALHQALTFGAAYVGEQGQHRQEAGNVEVSGIEHGGIFLGAATPNV